MAKISLFWRIFCYRLSFHAKHSAGKKHQIPDIIGIVFTNQRKASKETKGPSPDDKTSFVSHGYLTRPELPTLDLGTGKVPKNDVTSPSRSTLILPIPMPPPTLHGNKRICSLDVNERDFECPHQANLIPFSLLYFEAKKF